MKFEIECDIPDGYEPTGEYRAPKNDDEYYLLRGTPCRSNNRAGPQIILRKLPPPIPDPREWWPKWLLAPWVAKTKQGLWFSFLKKPILPIPNYLGTANWSWSWSWSAEGCRWIDTEVLDMRFPDVPWEQSCFRNPWLEEDP